MYKHNTAEHETQETRKNTSLQKMFGILTYLQDMQNIIYRAD